jgi:hypothetical protein
VATDGQKGNTDRGEINEKFQLRQTQKKTNCTRHLFLLVVFFLFKLKIKIGEKKN